jgi:hypothetical protein
MHRPGFFFVLGQDLNRHCEEQSDEAIHSFLSSHGLLRFARNDERDFTAPR